MQPEGDSEVGYKKPPKHTQFPPGKCPNPKGRPRKSKNLDSILGEVLDEKVSITENGRRRTINKAEAMYKSLVNKAVKGDIRATQTVMRMMETFYRYKKARSAPGPRPAGGPRNVVILPDNGRDPDLRDPELVAALIRAQDEYYDKKAREAQWQNPANENRGREVA